MEREKSTEAMWKQVFQIQKYYLLKIEIWNENIKLRWEINPFEKNGCFHFNFKTLKTPPVAASLESHNENVVFLRKN